MKNLLTVAIILFVGLTAYSQESTEILGPILFAEYPMQIESSKADIDRIEAPVALTVCELEDVEITFTYKDVTFSGGKHGTLERTWIATDACGNSATTIQYIAIRD